MPAEISPQSFEKFVQERKYLHNVSPKTEQIYRAAWSKWEKYGPDPVSFVAGMREAGMNPVGCNMYIRSLNAFFNWAGQQPIRKLKEEDKVPPTFSPSDIQKAHQVQTTFRRTADIHTRYAAAGCRSQNQ